MNDLLYLSKILMGKYDLKWINYLSCCSYNPYSSLNAPLFNVENSFIENFQKLLASNTEIGQPFSTLGKLQPT